MKRIVLLIVLIVALQGTNAQGRKAVETSTDVAMFAPAAVGAGVALLKGDSKGLLQLGESLVASVAVSYALKYTVKKERPDDSDIHSFPSNHTGFSFAGATFLQNATAGAGVFPPILSAVMWRGVGSMPNGTMSGMCLPVLR